MKKVLRSLVLILFFNPWHFANAQSPSRCATMEHLEYLKSQDPGLEARMAANEQLMQDYISNPSLKTSNTLVTIPVIVHVVYGSAAQNISDVLIQSQIDVLNEDYGAYNADIIKVPPYFQSLIGNPQIKFQLASRDPSGNATNGIVRVSTSVGSWSTNDAVKHTAQGGDDAWPAASYLNIWVCNLGSSLLGYAQFPGGAASTDGVVILYSSFGRISSLATYNYGRTTTHEVGHWLNLRHIWGDSNCGNDLVSDTPVQQAANFGCPCQKTSCTNTPIGEMYMNYMDYTDDVCMYMFSGGQVARTTSAINVLRSGLLTSQGCVPPSLNSDDAGISDIVSPSVSPCDNSNTSFTPEVVLTNYGSNPLTSCTINYKIDNNAVQTYTFNGNIASGASANVILTSMTASTGDHIFYCYTTNPNGGPDGNPVNDRITHKFIGKAANVSLPVTQDFTSATFPPTGWTSKKYDCTTGWLRTTTAYNTAPASIYFNNFAQATSNIRRYYDLYTQTIDLTTMSNPHLGFNFAYAPKTGAQNDTLEILISTDCGYSYVSLNKKWGVDLLSAPAQAAAFTPTASQWRHESLDLNAYSGVHNAIFIFRNITGAGNNLYLDDIAIDQAQGIYNVTLNNSVTVFPNPGDGLFYINLNENNLPVTISVVNAIGEMISKQTSLYSPGQMITLDMRNNAKGIYFLKIENDKETIVKKLSLD